MNDNLIKVLLIEDDIVDQMSFRRLVNDRSLPYDYSIAGSVKKAKEILQTHSFDVIIADYNLGDGTAFDIFDSIKDVPLIFTTGGGDEMIAVDAMKAGAYYYHIKDPDRNYLQVLPVSIEKALADKKLKLERKNAEEALKESEEKFRAISSAANDAIIMMNYEGNISFWNKAAEKIFGFTKQEIMGKNLHANIVPPDSKDNYLQGLKYFWETGTETALGKTVEMTVLKKKGIEFDIELSLSAVKIEKELNTIAIIRDITERKHAEQALQESEERYRSLQENIPLGIYRITRQGKFISANHSMVRILNYNSRDELLKPSRIQLYAFKDQQEIFFQEMESNSFVSNYEIQLLKKNGDIFWAEINARAIRDELGSIIYYDGILEDITLQKQAKEELRQSKERLDIILQNIGNGVMVLDSSQNVFITNSRTKELLGFDPNQKITPELSAMLINCHNQGKPLLEAFKKKSFSNLELNVEFPLPRTLYVTGTTFTDVDGKSAGKIFILADVTKEKDIERLKTDFVSSVSHELRTPITSIMGFAQTMLRNKEINNDIREEFLGIIHRESKRLSNLIEDVLSISRIESGKIHYDMSEISLGPIIQEVYNIYKIQAEKKNLRISCNVGKNLPKINADKDAVHQIIVNFIGNAIKFTESGDSVTISLKKINDWLCLEITDTGLGIPKKDQARIFDKFYRVSRPGTEIPGTGLGLSIVKEIVELHGGKIEMESEEGKGTAFRTFFPLSKKSLQKTG